MLTRLAGLLQLARLTEPQLVCPAVPTLACLAGLRLAEPAPEAGDLDVALGYRSRNPVERLIGGLHVVSPEGPGRAQHRDIRRCLDFGIERRPVRGKFGQLAATPEGD
jgi:hypothetical protein